MTLCLQHIKTKIPHILSKLMTWIGLVLLFSFSGRAAGVPGGKTPASWDTYQLIITPINNGAIAGSGVNDVVRVTVVDVTLTPDMSNPATWVTVPNFPLSFTISGTVVSSTPNTNASGYYDYGLASNVVSSADIIIQGNGQTLTTTFTYTAGPPATTPPTNGTPPPYFIVTSDPAPADGFGTDVVKIYPVNAFGVPYPAGTSVILTVTSSGPASGTAMLNKTTTSSVEVFIGADGTVSVPITNMNIGTVTLQATLKAYPSIPIGPSYSVDVHFVASAPDPAHSYLVVTQDGATANGVAQDIVVAYLYDAQGRPTTGTVNFSVGGSAFLVSGPTASGNTVTVAYADFSVESPQVTGTVTAGPLPDKNNPANNYVTINFVAGPPDPAHSYLVVTKDNSAADGQDQDIVTAYLYDAQGRPTTGTVNFNIPGSTTIAAGPTASGNTVAISYVDFSPETNLQVTGTVTAGPLPDQNNLANNYVTINFTIPPPDPAHSYIVVTQDGAIANGVAQDIVVAYLFDKNGNPTTGSVNFTVGGNAFVVSGPTAAGNTVTMVYADFSVENPQVTGSVTAGPLPDKNNPANNFVTIHFVVGQAVPGQPGGGGAGGTPPSGGGTAPGSGGSGTGGSGSTGNTDPGSNSGYTVLFVKQDFRLADGKQQDSVIAYITDANKHPVPGASVQFFIENTPNSGTATSGAQLASAASVTTDAGGMGRVAITSNKPGTVYIDAILTVGGVSTLIDGSYQIVTFENIPDVNNPLTTLSVVIYEALADGSQQTEVKAHIVDLDGNVMPGQDVTFSIDSGQGTIITPQPVTTDANGDAYIFITSKTPGDVSITAVVDGLKIIYGSPARVKFAPINIYVPKVFTPNNDGTNDVVKPILVGIQYFHYFSIYNRWGNLIFTTQDPNIGWDGRFKGVPQPVETYLWIAEGVDVTGKRIVQKGMISLVR